MRAGSRRLMSLAAHPTCLLFPVSQSCLPSEEWKMSMELFDARVTSSVRLWDTDLAVNPGNRSVARTDVLEWAYTSPEVHSVLASDLLLYEFAVSVFKQQTATSLQATW